MKSARIQPFCRKYNINIGCCDGARINPRNLTQRNTSLFIYDNHFCFFFWKSQNISFNQVIEDELKPNFKVVDDVVSDKHVESFIKYDYKHKKVQSLLTNIVVFDLETLNKVRAVPFCSCIYKLRKISGKYNRDISEEENQKCLNDCIVFKGIDCIKGMLGVPVFKRKAKKIKSEIGEYNL